MRRVILNFHGIGEPQRPLEPGEADYWVSVALFEEALDRVHVLRDRVAAAITIDDGNRSDIEIAAPRIAAAGMSATIFVLADRLDTPGSLACGDLRALQADGHEIGNHGAAHVSWRDSDDATLARELVDARQRLSAVTGRPVVSAAIPFGRYNARVLRALRASGYERCYSSHGGAYRPGQFPIPRTSLTRHMTGEDVDDILLGREPLQRRFRRHATMAIRSMI